MNFCKSALKVILFIGIFAILLMLVMDVLVFKQQDGTLPMRNYYDLPEDTVDVLFLGSSHIGMNVSTQILWDEYGIAGYKCWGSTQPVWNTYHYLVECLKTQKPKVVVVDVHGSIFSYDYADYVLSVKNTLGMRPSRNKIEAVMASQTEEQWGNLLLELPTYHTRYNELKQEDFEYFPWNHHNDISVLVNQAQTDVFPIEILTEAEVDGIEPLAEKEEKYLRMIIDLCRKNNIPLELITAPYEVTDFEVKRFRAVAELASEYDGLRFTNFNDVYADYGIDPLTDFLDLGHFNASGVPKYTRAIASLLRNRYELPDRRQDPGHIWNSRTAIEIEPVYSLDYKFTGDAHQAYVDTGLALYDNPLSSWTILTEFEMPSMDKFDKVIFSCYNETVGIYSGLLVNIDTNNLLQVRFSSYENIKATELSPREKVQLGVVKDFKTMRVYVNGERVDGFTLDQIQRYTGNLLIGVQQNGDGSLFRYSEPIVYDLQVFDMAMTDSEIKSWTPAKLSEPPVIDTSANRETDLQYALPYRYEGDGLEKYVDTAVKLYEDPSASWTLLARIDTHIDEGDAVYLSDFAEDIDNYRGLLVRRSDFDKLNILYGHGGETTLDIPVDDEILLAILKDVDVYSIYLNGELVVDRAPAPCESYGDTLLIGAEKTLEGELFRYSGTKVYNLEIVNGVMSEEDILMWNPDKMPEEPAPVPTPVDYVLKNGLAGDGKSLYIDTGIQLYDVSDKSWHLHMVLDLSENTSGTALSCFAEDPSNYRGLLVRQLDAATYGITLGKEYITLEVDNAHRMVLDIVKNGYQYKVYLNGELKNELNSMTQSWEGTLFVGAERLLNGEPYRFSTQKIRSLVLSSYLPSDEEILTGSSLETDINLIRK